MGRLENKVAFITGAARGQGRSHAVRLAQEGCDIIAVDICAQIETVPFAMGTKEDLAETVRLVEAEDRRIIASKADVRDFEQLKSAADAGVAELGRLDIVACNAGISGFGSVIDISQQQWDDVIGVDQTGVWLTCKATVPHIRAHGEGGSIVITSSAAGLHAFANLAHYASAKHGLVGLMRVLAAADELFAEAGSPHAITMEAIAAAAGVGKETLFRAFGSRDGLLDALWTARTADLRAAVESGKPPLGPGGSPELRIIAFLDALLTFKLDNRHLIRARERDAAGVRQSAGYRWTHGLLRGLIEEAAPAAAANDAGYAAHALLAALSIDLIEELLAAGRSPQAIRRSQAALAQAVVDGARPGRRPARA